MPEETITLRNAAQRLARIRSPKGRGIESSRLLSLLRSGELKAGFYFLGGTIWIGIPLAHWQGIDSTQFRIGRKRDDPTSGTYQIKASEFAKEVAPTLWNNDQPGPSREEVTAVIKETANPYQVAVKTEEFQQYLKRHQLDENKTTTNVGRRRKESWRELCSYMAAYFAAHQRDRGAEPLKIDRAKTDIIKIATDDQVPDLPEETTIKEQISKAIDFLQRSEFKLRMPTAGDRE
jgi:hypothetical protein